nr:hypothetical protein [Enterococcus casseliflavus]
MIKRVANGYRNFYNFRARIHFIQVLIFQISKCRGEVSAMTPSKSNNAPLVK